MTSTLHLKPSTPLVAAALEYAATEADGDTTGHDFAHISRVFITTQYLARREGAYQETAELIAALHDVADFKFTGDENSGADAARAWLLDHHVARERADIIADDIAGISFKGANTAPRPLAQPGRCVQDADRLDAIGAIGLARCFAYGGAKGRPIHDPTVPVVYHETTTQYLRHVGTSINHLHEKTLLLRKRLNTPAAREIAETRHAFVKAFLVQFMAEWNSAMYTRVTVRLPPMDRTAIDNDLGGDMNQMLPGDSAVHCRAEATVMEMLLSIEHDTTADEAAAAALRAWTLYSNDLPTPDVTTAIEWMGESATATEASALLGLYLPEGAHPA